MIHFRLLRLFGPPRRCAVILGCLSALGVLVAATQVAQALVMARLFGRILDAGRIGEASPIDSITPWMLALVAILVLRPALVAVRELAATRAMGSVKQSLRERLGEVVVRRAAVDARGRSGADHALLVDGVENLDPYLSKYLPAQLNVLVTCTVVGIILMRIDALVGSLAIGSMLVLGALPRAWDRALARRGSSHWDAYQQMHADFLDSMTGMGTLVLAGADEHRQQMLERSSARLLQRTLSQLRLSLVESALATLSLSAIPVVTLVAALGRGLTATAVFSLVLLSGELVRPMRDLANHWHAGYAGTFSGAQLLDVLDDAGEQPRHHDAPGDRPVAAVREVLLRDVGYSYPGAERSAVEGFTLAAGAATQAGRVHAVVGASGSGKSTVAALLAGLRSPDEGQVLVDGRELAVRHRLEHVGLVPQDPVLFAGTVAENIARAVAHPDHPGLSVADAAAIAGIGTDDPALTLDTPVGDRGGLVSGGQRQRVAIARALHQGRPVLVLDEATSALDLDSDRAVMRRLADCLPDTVLVVVTHRVASLRDEHMVTVMAEGRVVEQARAGELRSSTTALGALREAAEVVA